MGTEPSTFLLKVCSVQWERRAYLYKLQERTPTLDPDRPFIPGVPGSPLIPLPAELASP